MISTVSFMKLRQNPGIRSDEACELRQELLIKLNNSRLIVCRTLSKSSNFGEALDRTVAEDRNGEKFCDEQRYKIGFKNVT